MWPPDVLTSPLPRYLIGAALAVTLGSVPVSAQLRADLVVSGLTQPVALIQDPSDAAVQYVVQQDGRVRVLRNGIAQSQDFLDLRTQLINSGEQGLLGMALAPDYAASGRVFVNFINLQGHTVIARFTRAQGEPLRADPSSRFDLMWPGGQRFITQPFPNHNGGNLVFGSDGFLYIGLGDGGSGNDPLSLAQNPMSLLGKMLRIDVNVPANDPEGYNVPSSNPFVGNAAFRPEIWSMGLRNPWRWSFDNPRRGGTGALLIADVGQAGFEEVNYEPAGRGGRNYGWPHREGAHNNVPGSPFSIATDPVFEYPRAVGQSITGGYVYRGSSLGLSYRGRYFFGDFAASRIWSIQLTVSPSTGEATASDLREHTAELGTAASNPSSFAEDANGELYIVNYSGRIHRLSSTLPPASSPKTRPPHTPVIGIAVPRSPAAPAKNSPARAAVPTTAPTVTVPVAAATPPPREASRTRLFLIQGEWWIAIADDQRQLTMPLVEFVAFFVDLISGTARGR